MSANLEYDAASQPPGDDPKSRLSRDMQGVVAVTGVLLKDAAAATEETLAKAGSQTRQKLRNVAEKLQEERALTVQKAQNVAGLTEKYVQENPWKSVGLSAVIGITVGLLLRRN